MSNIQTSKFVKSLASNHRKEREKALESLKLFISKSNRLSDLEYQKLWKGLFYTMWFSDKPRPQQRLARDLGELFLLFEDPAKFAKFTAAFWHVICREWVDIDQWRIDKFYMLVRQVLRNCLVKAGDSAFCAALVEVLKEGPLKEDDRVPKAIPYHLCDIYLDELESAIFPDPEEEEERSALLEGWDVKALLDPFVELKEKSKLKTLREMIATTVLSDSRLVEWGVVEAEPEEQEEEEGESDDESDDEWAGFA
ncbi:unnamed protein product [Kuraishia capsulata CBS 1993]|uniref:Ribosomal RNA-processing protein 1 n=1 Tax=Kuraishia capsulata CBS 1993 TaxID=1382522 RepID=W6MFC5_9ASCO|nr:uncharacterized protein KUCA_T00000181001 [Kuraishia capsulata CBS 1993]CDK24221.1 unnamed protein product [Kuraishia capsulata CBS 1993]